MTSSHHLNMKRFWQTRIHPAAAQTRLEVKGIWVIFKGYEVTFSCKRHTYTITSSYHLNRKRLQQLGTEQQFGQSFVTNRPTDRPTDRRTPANLYVPRTLSGRGTMTKRNIDKIHPCQLYMVRYLKNLVLQTFCSWDIIMVHIYAFFLFVSKITMT